MKKSLVIAFYFLIWSSVFGAPKTENINVAAKLETAGACTFAVLGDPQNYIKNECNQPMFEFMTTWLAVQRDTLNIKAVLCTGDMVEQNDILMPNTVREPLSRNGSQTSAEQWKALSRAFERLDGRVPYILATGNHDYGYVSAENRNTRFGEYFSVERNGAWRGILVATCPNAFGVNTLENAAYLIDTGNAWGSVLVISIEFAARDEVLDWARELALSKRFADTTAIALTHSFINMKGHLYENEPYKLQPRNWGADIWAKFAKRVPNLRMFICGHSANGSQKFSESVSQAVLKNDAGKDMFAMMFNTQSLGGGWSGNGGDGWIRLLEFQPDGKTIKVKTHSPIHAFSPTSKTSAWRTEPCDKFDIVISGDSILLPTQTAAVQAAAASN